MTREPYPPRKPPDEPPAPNYAAYFEQWSKPVMSFKDFKKLKRESVWWDGVFRLPSQFLEGG